MNIFRNIRYFLTGLLMVPLGLALVWVIFSYLQPLEFLCSTIWTLLGQIPLFSQVNEALQSMANLSKFSMDEYLLRFPVLLFSALGDSLIICCWNTGRPTIPTWTPGPVHPGSTPKRRLTGLLFFYCQKKTTGYCRWTQKSYTYG